MNGPGTDEPAVVSYETLQFSWGGLFDGRVPKEPPWSLTHLVRGTKDGTPGPTLCGIDRFADRVSPIIARHVRMYEVEPGSPIPGWSVGGGISGPDIAVARCEDCAAARDASLPVTGLNSDIFGEPR